MKPVVRYIIAAAAVTACLFLWLVGDRVGAENRREVTCNSVDAIIADSLAFISPDDIKDWMADYGTYLGLTQRLPVVRFQNASGGFYADAEGFLFPLQQRHTVRVPIVDGALPIKLDKNFKGEPQTEQEKEWVLSVLDLVRWLDARKEWNDLVGQISVRKDGNLVLVPREGAERFVFGTPTDIDAKFGRIRKYYESIAPSRENPYKTVDVRFDGQIICRNK